MRKKFHLWMPLFALFGLGLFAAFSIGENKDVSLLAQYPEIPKPDYSGLKRQGFDPLLENAFEKMREDYHRLRKMTREEYAWLEIHGLFENYEFGPHTIAGDYILLLQKAGLGAEAEKILKLFPEPGDKRKFSKELWEKGEVRIEGKDTQNVHVYVALEYLFRNSGPQKSFLNASSISGDLYWAKPNEEGKYVYSPPREYFSISGFWLADFAPKNDQGRKEFYSFFDWAKHLMETVGVDHEVSVKEIENTERSLQGPHTISIHHCRHLFEHALLCRLTDRGEEAAKLLDQAKLIAEQFEKRMLLQNKKEIVEPVQITSVEYWKGLIVYYLKTKQYDEAEKAFESLKQSDRKYDNPAESFAEIFRFLCLENEIDRAERFWHAHPYESIVPDGRRLSIVTDLRLKVADLLDRRKQVDVANRISEGAPENRYSRIRYIATYGPTSLALPTLRGYYAKFQGSGGSNELGLLFLKHGDRKTARQIFDDMDGEAAARYLNQKIIGIDWHFNFQKFPNPYVARYQAGYRDETVDFLKSLEGPTCRTIMICRFVAQTVDIIEPEHARTLFEAARKSLETVPLGLPTEMDQSLYRQELACHVVSAALSLGFFQEAEEILAESRTWPSAPYTPKAYDRNRPATDAIWRMCCQENLVRQPRGFQAASTAAGEIIVLKYRYDAFKAVALLMLFEKGKLR